MAFPLINPKTQFFDSSGSPLSSGTLEFRSPTTNDLIDTFPSADDADAQTNANDNPLELDSSGRASVYLEDGVKYKIILKDADGVTFWTEDDVRAPLYSASSLSTTLTAAVVGGALYATTSAETTAGVTPTNFQYEPGDIRRYGAVGDDSTDNATAIQNAIDIAEVSGGKIYIPEGTFRIETGLTVQANLTICGASVEKSIIKKNGSITGITISRDGVNSRASCVFRDFGIDATNDASGVGLLLSDGGRCRFYRLLVQNHGSHGVQVGENDDDENNNLSTFQDIKSISNGGDGFFINGAEPGGGQPNANAMVFINIDSRANTGWGMNIESGYNNMAFGLTLQQNVGGGLKLNRARENTIFAYIEANTGNELELTSSTVCRANILYVQVDGATGIVNNSGADQYNWIIGNRHQAEFEPKANIVHTDKLRLSSQNQDGTDDVGNMELTHPSDRRYDFTFTGSGDASGQQIRLVNTSVTDGAHLGVEGKIGSSLAVANTNTPSGATSEALPWYDEDGTLIGYIPIYASQW